MDAVAHLTSIGKQSGYDDGMGGTARLSLGRRRRRRRSRRRRREEGTVSGARCADSRATRPTGAQFCERLPLDDPPSASSRWSAPLVPVPFAGCGGFRRSRPIRIVQGPCACPATGNTVDISTTTITVRLPPAHPPHPPQSTLLCLLSRL
ncbi:uncharacterized protein IWZ02DRAFT_31141 [Phyllosticta citriasiana]|uniref:uncharacterized protein n=1 Tax=Phyllosticta citriasiana TaxID=595635 RepID=UPI0030FD97C5